MDIWTASEELSCGVSCDALQDRNVKVQLQKAFRDVSTLVCWAETHRGAAGLTEMNPAGQIPGWTTRRQQHADTCMNKRHWQQQEASARLENCRLKIFKYSILKRTSTKTSTQTKICKHKHVFKLCDLWTCESVPMQNKSRVSFLLFSELVTETGFITDLLQSLSLDLILCWMMK